jgi:hypothetical protein
MPRWVILCLGAVLFVQSAAAGQIDERVFAAFEALCLDNMNELGQVSSFARTIGMPELNDEKGKLLLDGHPGHVWINKPNETIRYALILTNEGSCGVAGPNANGREILKLFLAKTRNQHLRTERIGSSVQSIFAVTRPSRRGLEDIHAIISITTSSLQTVEGVQMSAVPEALAAANGIKVPVWP